MSTTNPVKISKTKSFVFSLVTLVLFLVILNFMFSFIAGNKYIGLDPIDPKKAETVPGYFQPNQSKTILFPGLKDYLATTNGLGMRITSPAAGEPESLADLKGKFKVLSLGDSETFGNHVHDDESYPYRLQQIIDESKKDALVLNAGIGGTTIADHRYFYDAKRKQLDADIVLLQFFDNDLANLINWRPEYENMLKESRFDLAKEIKKLPLLRAFRKIELTRRWNRWLRKEKDPEIKRIRQTDSKDLNDNLKYIGGLFSGINTEPRSEKLNPLWDRYFHELDLLHKSVKEDGAHFVFIIFPGLNTLFEDEKEIYQDIIIKELKKRNIPYVDIKELIVGERDNWLNLYTDLPRDFHLSAYSKDLTAQAVYELIKDKLPS